jgi:hypothetical protein
MKYGAIAAFGITSLLVAVMLLMSVNQAFAGSYEKSQAIPQANECSNYWFPVNIICSNLNSQTQGEENNVAIATTPESESTDSNTNTNYGAPFP